MAFLDLDQELLAPRYRAAEEALGLLARASRLLGGRRRREGRLVLQTRLPDHEVVQAALHADPARVSDAERERRRVLGYPPATAMAAVSGAVADEYVLGLQGVATSTCSAPGTAPGCCGPPTTTPCSTPWPPPPAPPAACGSTSTPSACEGRVREDHRRHGAGAGSWSGPRRRARGPLSDRAREALFNILGPGIRGERVLDLFAGTGAVGLEALSRGALSATFVEQGRQALGDIRTNLDALGFAEQGSAVAGRRPGLRRSAPGSSST